jgi:prophage regulatory protein
MTQYLRIRQVMARTGLSAPTIYRRIAAGEFPKPVALGNPRIVGWSEQEVEDVLQRWMRETRGEQLTATA